MCTCRRKLIGEIFSPSKSQTIFLKECLRNFFLQSLSTKVETSSELIAGAMSPKSHHLEYFENLRDSGQGSLWTSSGKVRVICCSWSVTNSPIKWTALIKCRVEMPWKKELSYFSVYNTLAYTCTHWRSETRISKCAPKIPYMPPPTAESIVIFSILALGASPPPPPVATPLHVPTGEIFAVCRYSVPLKIIKHC